MGVFIVPRITENVKVDAYKDIGPQNKGVTHENKDIIHEKGLVALGNIAAIFAIYNMTNGAVAICLAATSIGSWYLINLLDKKFAKVFAVLNQLSSRTEVPPLRQDRVEPKNKDT